MNHIYNILFFFLLASNNSFGQQNLILNGDFEEYWECPDDATQVERCKYVYNPCEATPSVSTSDYFNKCYNDVGGYPVGIPNTFIAYQLPYSGDGMLGFANTVDFNNISYCEYIQLSFTQGLICGRKYIFSAYFNLSNTFRYSLKSIGFYFSTNELNESDYLYNVVQPQFIDSISEIKDTLNWTKISFEFTADKSYNFVSIGHFQNNGLNSYFEINPLAIDQSTSTYFFMDNVELIQQDNQDTKFPNVFTPNIDGINDLFEPVIDLFYVDKVVIVDRWGIVVKVLETPYTWDGTSQSGLNVSEGVYFYICNLKQECIGEKNNEIFNGMVHLIR